MSYSHYLLPMMYSCYLLPLRWLPHAVHLLFVTTEVIATSLIVAIRTEQYCLLGIIIDTWSDIHDAEYFMIL